ncbi:uncharacterized [Tachysurus ichikawai]
MNRENQISLKSHLGLELACPAEAHAQCAPRCFPFQQLLGGAGIPTWQYRWWSVSPAITWSGSKTPATETGTGRSGSLARFPTSIAGRQKARDGSAVSSNKQRERGHDSARTAALRADRTDTRDPFRHEIRDRDTKRRFR